MANKEKDDQSIMDKSMRSVFVGNIPYEATEEKLKDIFSEVGPVLSFKLVFDRETGKPKGYGFCEYKDQETALSAMRNLNGYEIGGRSLRVDNACTEKSRMEMQALMQGPLVENPYGEPVEPEKTPEAISKAVATLPPEQMFELMKQMKLCIQNNPTEARNMLLQNPQLAYALLQAQVIMRIVDPGTAVTMLHPLNPVPPPLHPSDKPMPVPAPHPYMPLSNMQQQAPPPTPLLPTPMPPQHSMQPPMQHHFTGFQQNNPRQDRKPLSTHNEGAGGSGALAAGAGGAQDVDLRSARAPPPLLDQDMRSLGPLPTLPPQPPQPPQPLQPPLPPADSNYQRDPRMTNQGNFAVDPRVDRRTADPRQQKAPPLPPGMPSAAQARTIQGIPSGASDQEKAALIMQVLQLSEEQIAMLPPEQRTSILVLKEQIAKSTQQR